MSDQCHFLALPTELRLRIFEHVWDSSWQYVATIDKDFELSCPKVPVRERETGKPVDNGLALLFACKTTWREARPVLMDTLLFNVCITGYETLPHRLDLRNTPAHHGFLSRIRRLHLHLSLQRQDDTAAVTHNLRTLKSIMDLDHRPPKLVDIEFDFRHILLGSVDNLVKILADLAKRCRKPADKKPDLSGRWSADIISPYAWKELREQVGAVNVWYIGGGGAPSWF